MQVAVLGMGRMGRAVAGRLLEGGHRVVVWNRSPSRATALVERGATEAGGIARAVSGADLVLTSLANDDAVRETALGAHGIVRSIAGALYVDASTVSPSLAGELDAAFERFAALPVLGAPQAVSEGTATYLAGGRPEVLDALLPVLSSLGGSLRRFERPQLAAAAKLTVNLVLLAGIVTLAEAVAVGRAGGLDDEQLVDLIGASPMMAPGMRNRLRAVVEGTGERWWTTVLAAKDAGLAASLGDSGGAHLRLAPLVSDLYREAARRGLEEEDMASVARLYRAP